VRRATLESRLAALEARLIEPTEPRKSLVPPWLMDELEKSVRLDASGYPEKIRMEPGYESQRGGGIQRAWLKKS
jgi:hypothetical protein